MKTYLLDSLNRIKRKGENLDAKTILCNKSWLIFNDSGDKELYIFQENGEVLISLNGIVSKGSWQYIPANKSIVISVKENSYMLHPSFMANNIMALKLDGTEKYMLMIEEKSMLAHNVKTLEDINNYFISIEEAERNKEQKEKRKEQEAILLDKETKLRNEANKAWLENEAVIMAKNKKYQKYKLYSRVIIFLTYCSLILFVVLLCNPEFAIEATLFILVFCILLGFAANLSTKLNKIYDIEKGNFLENYLNK